MKLERKLEQVIFSSRWLLAPFYLGLVVSLLLLMFEFLKELLHFSTHILELSSSDVLLGVLSLIDLVLAANLLLMVTFAGYESFVSRIDTANDENRPDWMGKVDFSGMKLKLVASIVAISAIHLLKSFMNISHVDKTDLMWMVITHMAFVVSGLLLAVMDWYTERAHHPPTSVH
jgi:uncharacterized protein (TIGR00645 family)